MLLHYNKVHTHISLSLFLEEKKAGGDQPTGHQTTG